MKKTFVISFVVLLSLLTSACSTLSKPEPETIYVTRIQTVPVPSHFLQNCNIPVPPDKATYSVMNNQQKENALVTYIEDLLKTVTKCNNGIDSTREWNEKQLKLFSQKPIPK